MAARVPLGQDRLELKLVIHGKVQGVFFRVAVRAWAEELGLTGYAANMPDGSVRVVAQGPRAALEELRERCGEGSEAARVDSVAEEWDDKPNAMFSAFEIR